MNKRAGGYGRIGIYGGAFNPVHYAHLQVATTVTNYLKLDCLIWVPVGIAWYKSSKQLASASDRLAMLELSFQHVSQDLSSKWIISSCEVNHQGTSYTIDTVDYLKQQYQARDWYLVVGMDQFAVLNTWHRWQELVSRCHLAVVNRTIGQPEIRQLPHLEYINIPFQKMDVSSTHVRELRAKCPDAVQLDHYLPFQVRQYIEEHHLYQ